MTSPSSLFARRFRATRGAPLGLAIVVALTLFAIAGPLVVPHDPFTSDLSLRRTETGTLPGPSSSHWLGVDPLFRDLVARLAEGARLSLTVALAATLVATSIGALAGVLSGMLAGTKLRAIDAALMRVVDALLALPFLLSVTAIGVALGRSTALTELIVLGAVGWTGTARVVRARTMEVRSLEFVEAARALGASTRWIITHHIAPNVAPIAIATASATVAQMILAEAVLGYLTVGAPPPAASWGRMLYEGERFLGARPALVIAPGLAIVLAVLGFARVSDGLRGALDPKATREAPGRASWVPIDLLLAAAGMLLLSLAAPNEVAPPLPSRGSPEPRRGGVVHLATLANLQTLDPALAYNEVARPMTQLLFARLVTWSADGRVVPELARAIERSPDGVRYRFELRSGVRFHDGAELGAKDVKRSIERLLHPKVPTPAAHMFETIRGASAYRAGKANEITGLRVLSERVIEIELERPDAALLSKLTLAFAAPVCPSMGPASDPRAQRLPCGAGPFKLAAWEPDKRVRFERHEGYFVPGKPYVDAIEWSLAVPSVAQRYKLERGEIDYSRDLSGADAARYRGSSAWADRGRWVTSATTTGVFLNTEAPPFDNRAIRRAVSFALDPSVLERLSPDVMAIDRVLPPSIPGPRRDKVLRRHDVSAALAAMKDAGYPFDPATKRGGYPREIDYLVVPDSFDQASAEIWQQQLARVGLRIRLRLVTYATYLVESARRGAAAMGKGGWGADFPDPSNFYEPLFSSSSIADDGSENASFYSNKELDALLDRAAREGDVEARNAMFARIEEILHEDAPWVPAFVTRTYELWHPYLRGYEPHAVLLQRFDDLWLDRATREGGFATNVDRREGLSALALGPWRRR